MPYSRELVNAVWLAAGGTILAGRCALRDGFGCNLGGGFHHAHADHGEGFCAIHDVAVAIRRLQADGAIAKAMVVDTDVHHGNGTAHIPAKIAIFTLSIHQLNNYPARKPPSTGGLPRLDDRVKDEEYLGGFDARCNARWKSSGLTFCFMWAVRIRFAKTNSADCL